VRVDRHGWRLRAGLRLSRLGDEWLVLDVAGGRVHRVSGAAARVLGRLLDGRDRSEVASDDELAAGLAHAGILESIHGRRDVLLGAATTGLMVATTLLPAAAMAASFGSVSYSPAPEAEVTVTDITIGGAAYRLVRVELATLDNGTATQDFQFAQPTTLDLLLVGGGGGGGAPRAGDTLPSAGGGGGAGEVVQLLALQAVAGHYRVRVGGAGAAEGAGGVGEGGYPTFFEAVDAEAPYVEAQGGNGGGGGGDAAGASSSGSGGGGGGATVGSTGGNVQDIAGRRNDGGDGDAGLGGGGGGAGTAGGVAGQATGGAGGAATDISEFVGLTAGSAFVAGGGGGAGATGGAGGSGGGTGASGTSASDATLGVNGTGGGGGGGYRESVGSGLRTGSRGGTGVALIRIHL